MVSRSLLLELRRLSQAGRIFAPRFKTCGA